jgi:glycosyltransferase involved in cell wall biosynthesis/radical SAM superfamily enzyme YgiQ (UPF0313 family)
MAYVVVFLATRWGSELGGLNVFNTGLTRGMSEALPKGSRCICYVDELPSDTQTKEQIDLRVVKATSEELAEDITDVCRSYEHGTLQGLLVIGHDSKTGQLAIDCASELKKRLTPVAALSAIVSHMDYFEYGHKKGLSLEEVNTRSNLQRQNVVRADHAFAVGPWLQASFQSARSLDGRSNKSPVKCLLPGAAEIAHESLNQRAGLQVFISGRLNLEDDTIKNGVLAVEALLESYRRGRAKEQPAWRFRGKLYACGVDIEKDRTLLASLAQRAQQDTAFEIVAIPFSNQQAEIHQHLASSHFALMPSWHEGFGLTGWEALCAGVPLICSSQSGLAMLLNDLRQQLPDVSFQSIEYVNLSGSSVPGKPALHDVDVVAEAIGRITEDLPQRKVAAINLAKQLKRRFSWRLTAEEVIKEIGWVLPSSIHWWERQQFAQSVANGASDQQSSDVVDSVMEILNHLMIEDDWGALCSAFNYFSDIGKQPQLAMRRILYEQLRTIGTAVAETLPEFRLGDSTFIAAIRNSGHLDVCWRYMAACASIATNFSEFAELFTPRMLESLYGEPFLRKEMLFYASRFSSEFPHSAQAVAEEFFQSLSKTLDDDVHLQTRLARLTAIFPNWSHVLPARPMHIAYEEEYDRCNKVEAESHDVGVLVHEDPRLVPTILALMSLRSDPARQLAEQAVGFLSDYQGKPFRILWRGDKRLYAGLISTGVGTSKLLDVLSSMAGDEDETIRWAALDLAFSRTLRSRLHASRRTVAKPGTSELNLLLGQIIDSVVYSDSGHPWLHREFLRNYLREHATLSDSPYAKFTINDFPLARHLLGPVLGTVSPTLYGSQHPEVSDARSAAQKLVKRVLFVLPPIAMPEPSETHRTSYTSTPPLGMGLLATYAASLGHDVQLVDCHRFPELCSSVTQFAGAFDLIGFNTVLSTLRSTVSLLKTIRRVSFRPLLVVGGPAAKLDVWRYSLTESEDRESWDFAISSAELENLSTLLSELDKTAEPWPSSPTLIANTHSPILASRDIRHPINAASSSNSASEPEWKDVLVDRRLFSGPYGQYEPARTRSMTRDIHEAHVVMSQGCDWDCAFCTERKSASGGEKRRAVDRVLDELQQLCTHQDVCVQFVDDNLLPQIAAIDPTKRVNRAVAVAWAEEFLNGMVSLRKSTGASFGWRGIFRLEDFFEYERQFTSTSFIEFLADSGCRMLAFGVEVGAESRRKRLKGGNGTDNERITDLFGRLREAGIHTKAYFMLGGRWESRATAEETIAFALTSGVTLAYFALYKEFVQATHVLSQQSTNGGERANAYLDYRQLVLRWDEALGAEGGCETLGSPDVMLSGAITQIEQESYKQLAKLGFRFDDLVKYNDYHSDIGKSAELLSKVAWSQPEEYFTVVEQAYRRFYLRQEFVDDYAKLIESGY